MPAGEGGRLFLTTRDQNFRVNPFRKKLYPEIEGEHLYKATRHFPEISCSHGFRCTRCQENLRRPRRNEPKWRKHAKWPQDPVSGCVGCGKKRPERVLQQANGGDERVHAIMTRDIPRLVTTSSLRRLKDIQSRPVTVDNRLRDSLAVAFRNQKELSDEIDAVNRAALETAAVRRAQRRLEEQEFRRSHALTFAVRSLVVKAPPREVHS